MEEINLSKEIKSLEKNVSPLMAAAQNIIIENQAEADEASTFLKQVNDSLKNIENKRLEFTAPLNKSLSAINASFRLIKEPLEAAKGLVGKKILAYMAAVEAETRKEEERRRKIQEAHREKGHDVNAPVVLERPDTSVTNAQTRKIWRYKIIDQTKVPEQYKIIDPVAVNAAIRSGERNIPGIEIYQDSILAVNGRER